MRCKTKSIILNIILLFALLSEIVYEMDIFKDYVEDIMKFKWKLPDERVLMYKNGNVLTLYIVISLLIFNGLRALRKWLTKKLEDMVKAYKEAEKIFRYQIWRQLVNLRVLRDCPIEELMN